MMLRFACRDVGVDCDFVATGDTAEDVKNKAFAHAGVVHADLMNGMNDEQKAQMVTAVEASIRPA
jgi:predicted small metal-binding protein